MFSRINQLIIGGLGAVILGLGVWSWWQSSTIDSLQATNQAQAQTIEQMNLFNEQLNTQLKAEQQAVIFQQKIASELKSKMEQVQNDVKATLRQEHCANVALPRAVIDGLKRLQHKDKD